MGASINLLKMERKMNCGIQIYAVLAKLGGVTRAAHNRCLGRDDGIEDCKADAYVWASALELIRSCRQYSSSLEDVYYGHKGYVVARFVQQKGSKVSVVVYGRVD